MRLRKAKSIPRLEFRSVDNAWYDVSVKLIKSSYLAMHYTEFPEEEDEKLQLKDIKTAEEVRSRFRFLSKQLQDQHCDQVKEGMVICTSCSANEGEDFKFYDATVEQVCRSEHHLVDGEDQCTCTFKVLWQAGPYANQSTSVSCENVCLLTAGNIETHPIINDFVKLVDEKLNSRTQSIGRNTSRRKITNKKGRNATDVKDKQAELRERANGKVSDHSSGSLSSKSKIKEKKAEKGLSVTENVLTGSDPLLKEPAASDHELKSSVESESDIGSETKSSRCSHKGTTLRKNVKLSEISRLQEDGDMHRKEFFPPETPTLSSVNTNLQHEILPKNSKEATVDAKLLGECKETHLNIVRKEQNPNLSNLNSVPGKLQIEHTCTGSVSYAMGAIDTVGRTDKRFGELDDSVGIIENVRPCYSGNLRAGNCDNLLKESSEHNVVHNGIDEPSSINVDCGSYKSEIISRPLTMEENQEGQENSQDKGGKKKIPASWGRVKQQKHRGNKMLVSERQVQDNIRKGNHKNALEDILRPANDSNGVAALGSSSTTLAPKPINSKDSPDRFRDLSGVQHQTMQNIEEIGKDVDKDMTPKQLINNDVQTPEISLGPVDTEKGESVNVATDALRTRCLTDPSMKCNKRKDPCDSFRDLSDLQEQSVKRNDPCDSFKDSSELQEQTVRTEEHASKRKHFDSELNPSKILHEAVVISSDRDDETVYESKDTSRQHCNQAHLQELLAINVDPVRKFGSVTEDSEQPSHGHFNNAAKVEVQERRFSSSEVLVLDNLEKDVSCSDVIKVMSDLTSGIVQVYIVPCLNFEKFTSGFVLFHDRQSLMKAYARLQDDNFFVVSPNGRPWVVLDIEDRLSDGIFEHFTVNSKELMPSCSPASRKISFVRKGMKEYEKIKARKDTFLEFRKHFASLHERREDEDKCFMDSLASN